MPHIRERSCSIFPVHLGARRCHSDPLMTDGLANEIQFGFECDARPSEKNRLAGCEIGSVLLSKALAVTQSAGPVAVRVGAKSIRTQAKQAHRTHQRSRSTFGLPSSPWPGSGCSGLG